MDWSRENVLKLIEIYKTKSVLWDHHHSDHFKKNIKEDAWTEISAEMNTAADECKKKMNCLLSSNRREKNKLRSSMGTGNGRAKVYISRWFAYEAFKFLNDRDLPRMSLSTEADGIPKIEDEIDAVVGTSEQREQEATSSTSTPKSAKRAKRKVDDITPLMNAAFDVLKPPEEKLDKELSERNEVELFFKYVAAKVHKYSPAAQKAIQHAVFEILMKADKGLFD